LLFTSKEAPYMRMVARFSPAVHFPLSPMAAVTLPFAKWGRTRIVGNT